VGGIGVIEDLSIFAPNGKPSWGVVDGENLYLVGGFGTHMGASAYVREILDLDGHAGGPPPPVDLELEKRNGEFVREAIRQGWACAAKDISEGGFLCAAAEFVLQWKCGLQMDLPEVLDALPALFGEDQGRYIVAIKTHLHDRAAELAAEMGVDLVFVGDLHAGGLSFNIGRTTIGLSRDQLYSAHEGWLPRYMKGET